jgi:hypothetical protein
MAYQGSSALPGQACSRAAGRGSEGRGRSRPRRRETVGEAEAALRTRVAVEAEAGEMRAHALPSKLGGEGVRKTPYLSESERGKGVRRR